MSLHLPSRLALFWLVLTVFPALASAQSIYLGMPAAEVVRALGEPAGSAEFGNRQVLQYPGNVQVILRDGRIIDVKGAPYHYDREFYLAAHGGRDPLEPEVVAAPPAPEPPGVIAEPEPAPPTALQVPTPEPEPDYVPTPPVVPFDEEFDPTAFLPPTPEAMGYGMPDMTPPSGAERAVASILRLVINLFLTWFVLFVSFKVVRLETDGLGLIIVAGIDLAVRGTGSLLAWWILDMDSFFGMERIFAVLVMLVAVMKFTTARTIPTAVRITIMTAVVTYILGYLAFMIPLTALYFAS